MNVKFILFFFFFLATSISYSQSINWVSKIESQLGDAINKVEFDSQQNMVFAGRFTQTIDLDPGTGTASFTAISTYDIFVAKLDPQGTYQWGFTLASTSAAGSQTLNDIIIDESDNLFITGRFVSNTDFDPGPAVVNLNIDDGNQFVAKYDSDGALVWVFQIGNGNNVASVEELALSQDGHLYLAGYFEGLVTITDTQGSTSNMSSVGYDDIFIAKFNASDGSFIWRYYVGDGSQNELIFGVSADSEGNAYVTGVFYGTIDFDWTVQGESIFQAQDSGDAFVMRINNDGTFGWAGTYTAENTSVGFDIEVNSEDDIVISGGYGGLMDIDMGPAEVLAGGLGVFLTKIDNLGTYIWHYTIVGNNNQYSFHQDLMVLDTEDAIYHTGSFDNPINNFDIEPAGGNDIFISKFNTNGEVEGGQRIGGIGYDGGSNLAIDADGNLALVGLFSSTVDFEIGSGLNYLNANEGSDFFISSLNGNCLDFSAQITDINPVICNNSGTVIPEVSGGTTPYNFQWDNANNSTDSIAIFENAGFYNLTITDDIGCQRITNFELGGTDASAFDNYDLTGNLITSNFRPGFNSQINLDIYNKHCIASDAFIKLVPDPLINFQSANPAPDAIINDTLIWNVAGLSYDSTHFTPQLNFEVSTNAMIGDSIVLKLILSPQEEDANEEDNFKIYKFPVVNGYDPNDKQVFPSRCDENYILPEETLTYTVRFQNTGNAEAINIHILDTLDANLDFNTLTVVGQSHSLVTELLEGGIVNFRFDNINLIDSLSNEAASQGYVVFEIQSNANLSSGTIIENKAAIYFDFNPPIITNTVYNEIIEILPNCFPVPTTELSDSQFDIQIFPNPSNEFIEINLTQECKNDYKIQIIDQFGNPVKAISAVGSANIIDVHELPSGIYHL